jgi:hypothetical protein
MVRIARPLELTPCHFYQSIYQNKAESHPGLNEVGKKIPYLEVRSIKYGKHNKMGGICGCEPCHHCEWSPPFLLFGIPPEGSSISYQYPDRHSVEH